jgi:hypothetical protein
MRLRYVVSVGLLLVASGCQDRNGLDFNPDGGGAGQTAGTGGHGAGGIVGSGGITGQGGAIAYGGSGGSKPDGGPMCGPVCDIYCQYGNAVDDNGCQLCKCNPPPVCPDIGCGLMCPYGYAKDKAGCETCACNPPPVCKPLPCQYCPGGYVKDANGCNTCQCIQGCPAIACPPIACPYGFLLDGNGCNTCKCRDKPVGCDPVACDLYCPGGFLTDPMSGCTVCKCKPTTCAAIACKLYCPYGYRNGGDGCPTCSCNPATCAADECPAPPPALPTRMCSDGSTAGATCTRDKTGTCGWSFTDCPPECSQIRDPYSCGSIPSCTWLEPGCSEPSIPVAGCYARSLVNCNPDTCPAGKQCQKRTYNPCAAGSGPGTLVGGGSAGSGGTAPGGPSGGATAPAPSIAIPPPPQCMSCAAGITICL